MNSVANSRLRNLSGLSGNDYTMPSLKMLVRFVFWGFQGLLEFQLSGDFLR